MRTDFEFESQGNYCVGWLYQPESTTKVPCVVMAHGFSAVREQRLDAYAQRFVEAGMAVLLFDYRHFGESEGEPRQLLSISKQLEDWRSAVQAARRLTSVDASRIALFGSSFSGGHVQSIAAEDAEIAAVIAQAPFCDGLKNLPALGLSQMLKLSLAGVRDLAGSLVGAKPYHIAAVGNPGELAVMVTPDAVSGFAGITPADSTWRNEVCARIALAVGGYRPGTQAGKIRCPILYTVAEDDTVTPAKFAHEAAKRAPKSEVKDYACGHFDVYVEPLWEQVVSEQTEFLARHLGLAN